MVIVDYKKKADTVKKSILKSKKISQPNKDALLKFLDSYDVSYARLGIFLNHIKPILERTQDITKDMQDRDKINKTINKIRQNISPGYYATIINVTLRFVRWLNDGEKPQGFKDIKRVSEKHQKRNLSPQDMITWEEGEQLIEAVHNSIQMKAIIATQLDGGFRPSEFLSLNYGDVTIKENFMIIEVKDGKTGRRNVILWRSVPHLLRWYKAHPTKKPNDPLWLQEDQTDGKIIRYKYAAIRKRLGKLYKKVGIDHKPHDFYTLRHSACVLSKKDNVPEELAAEKFGHSIHYYVETYGRLTAEDKLKRYSKHYGLDQKQESVKKTLRCKCGFINEPDAKICEQCQNPITLGQALKQKKETEKRFEEINKRFEKMEQRQKVTNKVHEKKQSITNKEAVKEVIKEMFRNGELNPVDFATNI
jgi:integrase